MPGRVRSFKCVANRRGYRKADWALRRSLWAPKDEPADTADKASAMWERYQRSGAEGLLTIKDVRHSKSGTETFVIEHMRFQVEFFPPPANITPERP